jgi:hypothetical protein
MYSNIHWWEFDRTTNKNYWLTYLLITLNKCLSIFAHATHKCPCRIFCTNSARPLSAVKSFFGPVVFRGQSCPVLGTIYVLTFFVPSVAFFRPRRSSWPARKWTDGVLALVPIFVMDLMPHIPTVEDSVNVFFFPFVAYWISDEETFGVSALCLRRQVCSSVFLSPVPPYKERRLWFSLRVLFCF